MRVCYISTQAKSVDGWGRYTVEVALGARSRGIDPVLITSNPEVDPALADVPHFTLLPELFKGRATTLRTLLLSGQVRSLIANCDVVHVIAEPYMPVAALAAPKEKPLILSAFGTWAIRPLEKASSRVFFAPAFKRADVVLCISGFTRDWLLSLLPDLRRTEVLPGGVHPEKFEATVDTTELPEWIGYEPAVFSAGAVKPRKGQHIALEAVALAHEHIPNLHYAMAGGLNAAPDYVERLRHRAEELGISDYVHFLGQLPPYGPLTAWYQHSDAFILPSVSQGSSFEGLGFVFLEAGAAGTPSIGTLDCGAQEAIRHGETGLLVPQDDPQATAEAIVAIVGNLQRRQQMGEAARAWSYELSWSNLADRVVNIYQELAAQ